MILKTPENLCVVCGAEIPEGRMNCPNCSEGDYFGKVMKRPLPEFKVDDAAEQAFRQGYSAGFNEGVKHTCEIKQDNERLKRENAFLKAQIEARNRVDDIDGCYD